MQSPNPGQGHTTRPTSRPPRSKPLLPPLQSLASLSALPPPAPRPRTPRFMPHAHGLRDAATLRSDQRMPYYVMPVLYMPNRIASAESNDGTRSAPRNCPQVRPPSRARQHVHAVAAGGKRAHTAPVALDASHLIATEETDLEGTNEMVVPTRDVGAGLAVAAAAAASNNTLPAPPRPRSHSAKLREVKRDNAIHEMRLRLLEALEMVELFQNEEKTVETKGTQCGPAAAQDRGGRPDISSSRMEDYVRQIRE